MPWKKYRGWRGCRLIYCTLEVQPPFCQGWFTNRRFSSKGLSSSILSWSWVPGLYQKALYLSLLEIWCICLFCWTILPRSLAWPPEQLTFPRERIVFQQSLFRCELLNFTSVYHILIGSMHLRVYIFIHLHSICPYMNPWFMARFLVHTATEVWLCHNGKSRPSQPPWFRFRGGDPTCPNYWWMIAICCNSCIASHREIYAPEIFSFTLGSLSTCPQLTSSDGEKGGLDSWDP